MSAVIGYYRMSLYYPSVMLPSVWQFEETQWVHGGTYKTASVSACGCVVVCCAQGRGGVTGVTQS